MKKEEFPTFLNEQPTIMFGRTGRELMIMACGFGAAYLLWSDTTGDDTVSTVFRVLLAAIPVLLSVIVALFSIAGRPLEEWALVLVMYVAIPKVFLYKPFDEDQEGSSSKKEQGTRKFTLINRGLTDDEDD